MSGIFHCKLQVRSGFQIGKTGGHSFIHNDFGQFHVQNASICAHRICRIGAQVHQHTMNLRRIGQNRSFLRSRRNVLANFNG